MGASQKKAENFFKNALLVAFSLVFFYGFLEIGARFLISPLEKKNEDPYVGFSGGQPLFVKKDGLNGEFYTTSPAKLKFFNSQIFPQKKAPNTIRIFSLGGSTTYGRPFRNKTSFSGWTQNYLSHMLPHKKIEVVNAGGISYASYRVAELMKELINYQPDVFVVYTGHNEFLEQRTYGSLKQLPKWLLQGDEKLMSSRLYSLVKNKVSELKSKGHRKNEKKAKLQGEVQTILDNSIGPSSYFRDDTLANRIAQHYELSVMRMVELAKSVGAKILFVNTPSNIKDCAPFKSQTSPGLSIQDSLRASKLMEKALEKQNMGEYPAAGELLEEALQLDSRNAQLLYAYGKNFLELGEFQRAKEFLIRARDEDVCPLRATSSLLEKQKQIFTKYKLPYVPWLEILERKALEETGKEILGEEYFLDHVHLTMESHRQLALEIISKMEELNWLPSLAELDSTKHNQIRDSLLATIDKREMALSLNNLAKVYNWAGKIEDAVGIAKKALEMDTSNIETAQGALLVGTDFHRKESFDSALFYYNLTLQKDSNNMEARRFKAMALQGQDKTEKAIEAFEWVLQYNPQDVEIRELLARSYLKQNNLPEAQKQYETLLKLSPNNISWLYTFGRILYNKGDLSGAKASWSRLLSLNPNHRGAKEGLSQINGSKGRNPFQRKLTPAQQKALQNLKRQLGKAP